MKPAMQKSEEDDSVVDMLPLRLEQEKKEHETEQGDLGHPSQEMPTEDDYPSLSHEFFQIAHGALTSTIRFFWWLVRAIVGYFRYHPLHALLNGIFLTLLGLVIVTGSEVYDDVTLSQISDRTVEQIVEASKYTRDYSSVRVQTRGTIELLGVGAPKWTQREAVRAVLFHARKAGLSLEDQAVLLATVEVESGFNPMARAPTTSACGLFQFVKKTGELFGLKQADCMNPWLNSYAGVKHYISNYENRVAERVEPLDGAERAFRKFELSYYLHHDGPNSTNHSKDVKAVVLSGTQFLFRALQVLEREAQSKQYAPTFAERFTQNLWKFLDSIREMFLSGGSTAMAETKNEQRDLTP